MNSKKFTQFAQNISFMGVVTLMLMSISLVISNHYGTSVVESDLYKLQNQISADGDLDLK